MKKAGKEVRLQGIPISDGVAIGVPFFFLSSDAAIPHFPIELAAVEGEIGRYRKALGASRLDLEQIREGLQRDGFFDAAEIMGSLLQMLEDPLITTHVETKIKELLLNVETVFQEVIMEYESHLEQTARDMFADRFCDVTDLAKRILRHLNPAPTSAALQLPPHALLFAHELVPSQTASFHPLHVNAFVTYAGGGNSHAALIARAKGIPYVVSIDIVSLQHFQGILSIVDGGSGEIIFNPSSQTLRKYKRRKAKILVRHALLQRLMEGEAQTLDGHPMNISANINHLDEIEMVAATNAAGIGLLRSEYLFPHDRAFFCSEEAQYATYREVVAKSGSWPVVIRAFDLGGDKGTLGLKEQRGDGGTLGEWRGIRFLLKHLPIFKAQIKAVLRAGLHGDVRLLLPLVSDIAELHHARRIIAEVQEEMRMGNVAFSISLPIGCMIELPSAALISDILAQESDFLSIGTNDLVQYTLGIDRSGAELGMSYATHPSVIRMIKMVVGEAHRLGKQVTICGEVAARPCWIPLLVGLGVTSFSCSPRYIPLVKKVLRSCSLATARQIAQQALLLRSAEEIFHLLSHSSSIDST